MPRSGLIVKDGQRIVERAGLINDHAPSSGGTIEEVNFTTEHGEKWAAFGFNQRIPGKGRTVEKLDGSAQAAASERRLSDQSLSKSRITCHAGAADDQL